MRFSILTIVGLAIITTLPFWLLIPGLSFLMEIALATAVMIFVVERRYWLLGTAALAAFILGIIPGIDFLPLNVFLPLYVRVFLPAFLAGLAFNSGRRAGSAFALGGALAALIALGVYFQWAESLNRVITELQAGASNMISTYLSGRGFNPEIIQEATDNIAFASGIISRLLPGLLVLSVTAQLFVAFLLVEWYYTRRDTYFPGFGPFVYWKIPEKMLYFLGSVLVVRLVIPGAYQVAADNILLVMSFLYSVCGLALVEHFLRRLHLPLFIKVVFYLGLVLMQLPGLVVTAAAGLFDSYFDFRRVRAHMIG